MISYSKPDGKARFYKVTDSHDKVHTRTTKSRTYSHAVVSRYPDPYLSGKIVSSAVWASRLDLAVKQAKAGDEVIPVEEITAEEYRAIKQ